MPKKVPNNLPKKMLSSLPFRPFVFLQAASARLDSYCSILLATSVQAWKQGVLKAVILNTV